MKPMGDGGSELAKARKALASGGMKSAIRHGWNSAVTATRLSDTECLEAVVALAATARERTTGRMQKDAQLLYAFSLSSLERARAGIRPRPALSWLFSRAEREPATKRCPDCAETILADANVCKYCGFRFDRS
jgi:hypothetical protein